VSSGGILAPNPQMMPEGRGPAKQPERGLALPILKHKGWALSICVSSSKVAVIPEVRSGIVSAGVYMGRVQTLVYTNAASITLLLPRY